MVIWFTGISGSGKSTLGKYFFKKFKKIRKNTIFFDGDEFRKIFLDWDETPWDIFENYF